ncbi:hypothetical protein [Bacillus cereus]|uniref:Uncharacterized protein n=1 Tax=Bacillus cereus TaxID=1396 RepID=A0A9X8NUX8_BACCE|nr:hypothetical protein [Bacillus cereus]RWQ72987.1 hypothetical protein DR116_0016800 [Bacillus cereus]
MLKFKKESSKENGKIVQFEISLVKEGENPYKSYASWMLLFLAIATWNYYPVCMVFILLGLAVSLFPEKKSKEENSND